MANSNRTKMTMSATKDLLPFPSNNAYRTTSLRPAAGRPAAVVGTAKRVVATQGAAGTSGGASGGSSVRGTRTLSPLAEGNLAVRTLERPSSPARQAGSTFAKARAGRALELVGSCLMIVTFVAAALFV